MFDPITYAYLPSLVRVSTMCPATATTAMISTGIGSAPMTPWPSNRNESGAPNTATAPVTISTSPRPTLSMPSVAMNGGSPTTDTSNPLTNPAIAPTAIPPRMPTSGLNPKSAIRITPSTPARAATEPTDRSMPPVMITMVTPTAMTAFTDVCEPRLNKLSAVRNDGATNDSATK